MHTGCSIVCQISVVENLLLISVKRSLPEDVLQLQLKVVQRSRCFQVFFSNVILFPVLFRVRYSQEVQGQN